MIKVFLVEDEIIMREGIKKTIDWEKEGFLFVGEASDGELAYSMIQKTKPDILITDIKMPFMDGLELSRLVKQELPDVKIIILSGYDEFEYAKEGIDIGITEYLLKPIAGAKLLEAVKKVGQTVLKEQEYQKVFDKERLANAQLARQKFFRRLVFGKDTASALLKEGREIGMDLAANRYNILLFQIFAGEEAGQHVDKQKALDIKKQSAAVSAEAGMDMEKQNAAALAIEKSTKDMPEILLFELGIEGWAFILKEIGERPMEEISADFQKKLADIMERYSGLEYFGGAGKPVERVSELSKCFEEAERAFAYRYLEKRNQIIVSGEFTERHCVDEDFDIGSLEISKLDRRITERFLKTGLKSEVHDFVDEYFESFGEQSMKSLMFRQYVIMDMYFAARALLEEIGYAADVLQERCGDFQAMAAAFSAEESSKQCLINILETAIELREAVSKKKYHSLLADAKSFIEQHYDDENISLNLAAANVNLSPNHFSSIFSQEMGQTFIEYLTHVRMEKAKELLRTSSMKTAEIAFAVGYKDPHYFSYLFKKTQECTPKEFRSRA